MDMHQIVSSADFLDKAVKRGQYINREASCLLIKKQPHPSRLRGKGS